MTKKKPRTIGEISPSAIEAAWQRQAIAEAIPRIEGNDTAILMHNDAVVQGLSEIPFMRDFQRWGILTIGTGLGNARFTNRKDTAPHEEPVS